MSDNIDDRIRDALSSEDADIFAGLEGEQSLQEMVIDSFRGRARWMVFLVMFFSLAFFVLAIVCAVQFFEAEGVRAMIAWAMGFGWSALAMAMMKVWYWMELNKNTVTREIKRVELQLARLAQRLDEE